MPDTDTETQAVCAATPLSARKFVPKMASPCRVPRPTVCERTGDRKSRAIGELSNVQTPLMRSVAVSRIVEDETLKDELKRKLAFEEVDDGENKDALPEKPRSSRTTAMKVSAALLQKITSNQSGSDLKITGLIPFDATNQLCEALANNESTDRLDLEGCGIGDHGCFLIKNLLIRNTRIKHVDLQMNQITDVGCKYLAESISQNTTLQRLYLGYNDIRDDGVLALIAAMRPRGQLEIVVSGNTHVSDEVLCRLDRALELQWTTAHMSPQQAEAYFQQSLSPPAKYVFRRAKEQDRRSGRDDLDRRRRSEDPPKTYVIPADDEDEASDSDYEPAPKKSRTSDSSSDPASSPRQPSPSDVRPSKTELPPTALSQPAKKAESAPARARPTAAAAPTPPLRSSPKGKEGTARELSEEAPPVLDSSSFSEIYTGVPFTFTVVSVKQPASPDESSGGDVQRVAREEECEDPRLRERRRLEMRFSLEWARLRQSVTEQLSREARILTPGPRHETLFESSCRFLSRRQFAPNGHRASGGVRDVDHIGGLALQSESNRRQTVEARVRSLLLKFRHIQEDIAREQRCQAHFLAAMHGSNGLQGPLPAGCSPEPTTVHVPCPFRVEVRVHGLRPAGDAVFSF